MGPHDFVRRRAHVHPDVMEHQIFDLQEFALAPQSGAGVEEMRAKNEGFGDGTGAKPLVETRGVRRILEGRFAGARMKPSREDLTAF